MFQPAKRLDDMAAYYFAAKLAYLEKLKREGGLAVINLGIGSPDLPPADVVTMALQEGLKEKGAHQYQPYKGTDFLREAFASWYKDWFEVVIRPETEILPLLGSKEGIMHITMAFVNPGDKVLIPDPGYPSYASCTKLAGGISVPMPLHAEKGWKPDLDALAKEDLSEVKLMWLNYPNMPTGARADIGFFRDIVSFAKCHQILLCHDNPYVFLLNDSPVSLLQADSDMSHSLELTSLSKSYNMAGWRVGAVCGHAAHINSIMAFRSQMDSGMFRPVQRAAAMALSLDRTWIHQLNQTYRQRQEVGYAIMDALKLDANKDASGLFLWGKITDAEADSEQFSDRLLASTRIFITPGFIFGKQGRSYLRISLCSPVEELEAALYRIKTTFTN